VSCSSLFLAAAARVPQRTALIEGARSITFGALRARGEECAARLRAAGIASGDRVVVLIPMSIELYAWITGVLLLDAVVMFVEPWMPLQLIAGCCAKANPSAILASPLGMLLATRVPAFRAIHQKLAVRNGALFAPLGWRTPPRAAATSIEPRAVDADTAVLTFTTGSSGTPKGVVRTHGLLAAQHHILSRSLRLTEGDVCLHAFANFVLNNLALGATSLLPSIKPSAPTKFSPPAVAREIDDAKVTSLVVPPASLDRLVTWAEGAHKTLPSIRTLATGGGPVPLSLLERSARVFPAADPEIIYGSSEVEPVSHLPWSEARDLRGEGVCVGKPVDDVTVRLLASGEIAVSGQHVSPRYFDDPVAMEKTKIIEGDVLWHRMGDTATVDAHGRLWLTGRVHTAIQTARGTVAPMPLERRAESLACVAGAAAVGVGVDGSARVILAVQPRAWQPPGFAAWRAEIAARVPEADHVLFVKTIPRDRRHRSKIDYAAVLALAQAEAGDARP
jgi:acyl-coenzyme A synthetase/AMP-(fatty) acid ligase